MRILVVEDDRKVAQFHPGRPRTGRLRRRRAARRRRRRRAGPRGRLRRRRARPDAAGPLRVSGAARHPGAKAGASGADSDGEGLASTNGSRVSTAAPTTTWPSRSRWPSCRRGFARCSAAGRLAKTSLRVADLEVDTITTNGAARRTPNRPQAERVRAARIPDAEQRPAGHEVAHHRARVGHPLRQRQQRRRSAHQLA